MELYGLPVWAACGSRMDAIAVPDDVERVVIFADNGTAGARGAERAATAHERPGRVVEIKPPVSPFKDWNGAAPGEYRSNAFCANCTHKRPP